MPIPSSMSQAEVQDYLNKAKKTLGNKYDAPALIQELVNRNVVIEGLNSPKKPVNPFNPFREGQTTLAERIQAAAPQEGSLTQGLVEHLRAPSSAAAGIGVKALGAITGKDVSQNPDVQNLPQNIERTGDVARVALPIAAGIATGGSSLPVMAAASGLAGATGQLTEDITDFATGEQDKSALGIAGSAIGAGLFDAAVDLATVGTFRLAKAGLARKGFDEIVSEGITKGVKPQFKGAMRQSPDALSQYKKKAGDAVADIILNKQNLEYVDDAGDIVAKGQSPKSLAEFAQAIQQRKKQIFDQYSSLSEQATKQGLKINLRPIVDKLLKYADDPVKKLADPSKTAYAKRKAGELARQGVLDPKQVENLIAELNQGLAKAFDNKAFRGISEVDGSVANALRESLDDIVVKSTGGQYQDLKKAYGALKSIEQDVGHRAVVLARQSKKGLTDLTDIFTGGDIISGAITGNPAQVSRGIFGRALKEYYKLLNSPDANIAKMFSNGEKALSSLPLNASKNIDDLPLSSFSPQGVKDASKMGI